MANQIEIKSEFPLENLPYDIKATRFGDGVMITLTDRLGEYENFNITVHDTYIYISTAGE